MSYYPSVLVAAALIAAAGPGLAQAPAPAAGAPSAAAAQPLSRAQFIAQMESQFRKIDADKNGQATRTEIEQFQRIQALAEVQSRNRQLFVELDADRNGQLTPVEFGKLATSAPATSAQPMLSKFDSSRDNQVSIIEYRSATVANFDRLDSDKDGFVTMAEMKAGGVSPR